MTTLSQSQQAPGERSKALVVVWPGTLGHPGEWEMNADEMFGLVTSFLETVREHEGNMVVVESRWWRFQEGYMRYLIDRKLMELASKGFAVRRVLEVEDDEEVQEFDEVTEWTGFGGIRKNLIFRRQETLWASVSPFLNHSDVFVAGGWQDEELPRNSPIDTAAVMIRRHCPNATVTITDAVLKH
ncbi:hypothetical protein ATO8_18110 [Roseivivax marinus]|uniref:Uncharacterized protein n=1 Tax=Roseivivax marinus TaxID=1379903 RepID=W4HEV7_9RHOB|nr:hypothetical protein [Roseivivax marinus]ETW11244.1 hypothetical protein ATO8_18110 [Roseivivax marinus]